jgi:hypothetical protein
MRALRLALLLLMVPAFGHAAAKVKSHSNTNNNRFAQQCLSGAGVLVSTGGSSVCSLPKNATAAGAAELKAACTADGGKPVTTGGAIHCDPANPTPAAH